MGGGEERDPKDRIGERESGGVEIDGGLVSQ